MADDDLNIFARILRGEIPCTKVAEDEHTLAFNDINPARAVHVLVIPKGPCRLARFCRWGDARAGRLHAHDCVRAGLTGIAKAGSVLPEYRPGRTLEVPHLICMFSAASRWGP